MVFAQQRSLLLLLASASFVAPALATGHHHHHSRPHPVAQNVSSVGPPVTSATDAGDSGSFTDGPGFDRSVTGTINARMSAGSPVGFASGTTGGGNAPCQAPSSIQQFVSWLEDNVPRCILVDREYDFRGSMGRRSGPGCKPAEDVCGSNGQLAVTTPDSQSWCSGAHYQSEVVNYDLAGIGLNAIKVGSHKTIRGVGSNGIIRGRGLAMFKVSNIILQNVWITDLNHELVFGGDAIDLRAGVDNVWIDHCKFSLIGRQMITGSENNWGRVTISNTEFDGQTPTSSTCNNQHYWTMLFYGHGSVSLYGNWIHDVSGRAPKVGGSDSQGASVQMHAFNNYFENIQGNAFDVGSGGNIFAQNNYFENVETPVRQDPRGAARFSASGNVLSGSGQLYTNSGSSNTMDGVNPIAASPNPKNYAGIGKI